MKKKKTLKKKKSVKKIPLVKQIIPLSAKERAWIIFLLVLVIVATEASRQIIINFFENMSEMTSFSSSIFYLLLHMILLLGSIALIFVLLSRTLGKWLKLKL